MLFVRHEVLMLVKYNVAFKAFADTSRSRRLSRWRREDLFRLVGILIDVMVKELVQNC